MPEDIASPLIMLQQNNTKRQNRQDRTITKEQKQCGGLTTTHYQLIMTCIIKKTKYF